MSDDNHLFDIPEQLSPKEKWRRAFIEARGVMEFEDEGSKFTATTGTDSVTEPSRDEALEALAKRVGFPLWHMIEFKRLEFLRE